MAERDTDDPDDRTIRIVRNILALTVSSGLMFLIGYPVMIQDYESGLASLVGTVLLVFGLVAAVGLTFRFLDELETVAGYLVRTWRS
jgi:hypothetical protein